MGQEYERHQFYLEKIADCDRQIGKLLKQQIKDQQPFLNLNPINATIRIL